MAGQKIRYYLDENMDIEIARQLKSRGIDAITVRDLGLFGDTDHNHLRRAARMGCVLCTHDADFIRMSERGSEHSGIVLIKQHPQNIGALLDYLELMYAVYTIEDMQNKVEYV